MASTPEKRVKDAVKKLLAQYAVYQHWPVQNGMGKPCLDCHGCHCGQYFAIETKAPGNKLTERQHNTRIDIENAGGIVFVIDGTEPKNFSELKLWLRK